MMRILLVIDDYGELLFMQTLLKKMGFDVDGIQSERTFEEAFLALNPEIVVATASGKKVDGVAMADSIRRVRGFPKVILLASGPMLDRLRSMDSSSFDAILESPVAATRFLGQIAKLAELDAAVLLDKYQKIKSTLSPEQESDRQILQRDSNHNDEGSLHIRGEVSTPAAPSSFKGLQKPSPEQEGERRERFNKVLSQLEKPASQSFDRQRVRAFTKEIRKDEDPKKVAGLEAERQAFVKEMFKKAKKS